MSAEMSESLVLIWRIAELHARKLHAEKIEPHHLLLALAKCVDLDLTTLVPTDTPNHDELLEQLLREVRRIRTVFRVGDFDARTFRRRLRKVAPEARFAMGDGEILHRSAATKKLFLEAQHFAELSGQIVYPVHLLLASLFTRDQYSDEVMRELGIDKKHLQEIAKREIFTTKPTGGSLGGETKRGRN